MANIRDELATGIAESINKAFKAKDRIASFLDEDVPANVSDWISTGSSLLDLAISNRKDGGIPVGRITEIMGMEATGKSLIAAHALAEVQKKGGVAVYIDTETALSREFLEAIGVDVSNMVYSNLDTVEDIFEAIEKIIDKVRQQDSDKLVAIVVDSLAAASTKAEREAKYEQSGYGTEKAKFMSLAMRKINNIIANEKIALICTNQMRQRLGIMFGDPYTTSGGKALQFYASVRIRLKNTGQIKKKKGGVEEVIGIKTRAQVVKNRVGPPFRSAEFDVFFDRGIDDANSWLNMLKEMKQATVAGAWYTMADQNGEEKKFQSKDWAEMLEDDDFRKYIYDKICDSVIMKYRSKEKIAPEDLETVEGEFDE